MARHIVTGLDIGTSSIRIVVSEYKNGSNIPHIIALVKKNSKGLRRGYILQFDEAVDSIKSAISEAERIAGVRIKQVILGISGVTLESKLVDGGVIVSRADSEINDNDINRATELSENNIPDLANKTIIHKITMGFKLDGRKVLGRPEGMKGTKLEAQVLYITYSSHHLKDLVGAIELAGAKVDDVVASPLAASFAITTKLQKAAGCVLANIGSQTTSIIVFEEGIPISLKVFPIGSNDITNDIALGFQIPLEEAEKIKTGEIETTEPQKKLDEIISARLSDIFEFIENHLKRLGRNGLLPAGIIITGGGSGIAEIENLAREYFRLPAKVTIPPVTTNSRNQIRDSAWSVAYGLCLFGIDSDNEPSVGLGAVRTTITKIMKWIKELLP